MCSRICWQISPCSGIPHDAANCNNQSLCEMAAQLQSYYFLLIRISISFYFFKAEYSKILSNIFTLVSVIDFTGSRVRFKTSNTCGLVLPESPCIDKQNVLLS